MERKLKERKEEGEREKKRIGRKPNR